MKTLLTTVLVCSTFLFAACKKEKTNPAPDQKTAVYVAGTQWDSVTGRYNSCVWKNGTATLNIMPGGNSHYANAIFVSGSDVYTAGYENQPSMWKCQVWKNGLHQYTLGDAYSYGNAIAVAGADVYVGGSQYENPQHTAFIWKNELALAPLGTITSAAALVRGAAVSTGGDVYMAGTIGNTGKLWKNGVDINLANCTGADLKAVTTAGTDVYVTGNMNVTTIRYWKNNTHTDITASAGKQIFATGIAVENNDVYVSGWETNGTVNTAKYWKNGAEVVLGDGIRNSSAHGIAVKNGNVYIAGNLAAGSIGFIDYATLWENGMAKVIGLRNSRATAIVVK